MPESLAACARGEEAGVLAVLHIFTVGFQHARVGAGLGKNFAQHREIETERVAQGRAPSARPAVLMFITMLTSAFDLGSFAGASDVTKRRAHVSKERFDLLENGLIAARP